MPRDGVAVVAGIYHQGRPATFGAIFAHSALLSFLPMHVDDDAAQAMAAQAMAKATEPANVELQRLDTYARVITTSANESGNQTFP